MAKRALSFIALIAFALLIYSLIAEVAPITSLSLLADKYVNRGPDELGAANVVTSVVVTYRGLDTLGEVSVLFIVTAGIGFLLKKKDGNVKASKKRESSELLKTGATFLAPLIFLFGAYIFIHGHLTPGGGFQGGVVIASGVLLLMLTEISYKLNHKVLQAVESLSGATYVIMGILGIILMGMGHFLDNRLMPLGQYGSLFSAGAIPIIYSLIGLKVGSELTGILENLRGETA